MGGHLGQERISWTGSCWTEAKGEAPFDDDDNSDTVHSVDEDGTNDDGGWLSLYFVRAS